MACRVLIAEDDPTVARMAQRSLERAGYEALVVPDGTQALETLNRERVDAMLLDLWMPGGPSGLDVLEDVRKRGSQIPAILMSGAGNIESAVAAMRIGASDFIEKPFGVKRLLSILDAAIDSDDEQEVKDVQRLLIGDSAAMEDIRRMVVRIGRSRARVLITGETGTGKERVAEALHAHSGRKHRPFVRINCAAVPDTLIESELFGHEAGSFSGARARRIGRFEQADGGTILLDEIGDMSLQMQAKVLRVLEQGVIERVGSSKELPIDVRVIAATHHNLPARAEAGEFRHDLYYRLRVIPIHIPPLRDRPADVLPLARHFAQNTRTDRGRRLEFSEPAEVRLMTHPWPGNARELRNLVEWILVMTDRDKVDVHTVDEALAAAVQPEDSAPPVQPVQPTRSASDDGPLVTREAVIRASRRTGGRRQEMAELLGISRTSLWRYMKRYGLDDI